MQICPWNLGKRKFGSGAIYRVSCMCGSPKCDATILFDLEDGIFRMHMYKNLSWDSHWGYDHWWQKAWARIKASTKILFTGWIELEDDVTIDPRAIPDIIKMYQEADVYLKDYEANWDKEHVKNDNTEPVGQ